MMRSGHEYQIPCNHINNNIWTKIFHTHRGVMVHILPSKPGWFLIIHVIELVRSLISDSWTIFYMLKFSERLVPIVGQKTWHWLVWTGRSHQIRSWLGKVLKKDSLDHVHYLTIIYLMLITYSQVWGVLVKVVGGWPQDVTVLTGVGNTIVGCSRTPVPATIFFTEASIFPAVRVYTSMLGWI